MDGDPSVTELEESAFNILSFFKLLHEIDQEQKKGRHDSNI